MIRAWLILLVTAACSQNQQWLVTVTTDVTTAWGDRLLVEVLDDSGNVVGGPKDRHVTDSDFPLSFGVVPPDGNVGASLRVRARLYQTAEIGKDGLPEGTDLIDLVGKLPTLSSVSQKVTVVMYLTYFCFGMPADVANHQSCSLGSVPGTIDDERELDSYFDLKDSRYLPGGIAELAVPCKGDPPDGMACVQGAPFLMGSWNTVGVDTDYPPQPELLGHLVSGYFLDKDEVTVGTVRIILRNRGIPATDVWRRGDPSKPESCTYLGPNDDTNDSLPINCISQKGADRVCTLLGKQLPDELVWELAARNGLKEWPYPWGVDPPGCGDAWVSVDTTCPLDGPKPVSDPTNDVSSDGIRNLGGNVSEWTVTAFVPYSDDCWNYAVDNSCEAGIFSANWMGPWSHRGGSWDRRGSSAASFARFASPDGGPSPSIGFRCSLAAL